MVRGAHGASAISIRDSIVKTEVSGDPALSSVRPSDERRITLSRDGTSKASRTATLEVRPRRTEATCGTVEELLGHKDVLTTMIYTEGLNSRRPKCSVLSRRRDDRRGRVRRVCISGTRAGTPSDLAACGAGSLEGRLRSVREQAVRRATSERHRSRRSSLPPS